ncbi:Thiol:disulfide interchange protein DsbD [Falsiruegeria mediterranea M17]|uniref:Thiol:disulfide interchange protein DsbD n=2 Tax=Falsiruegeria TaxID=2854184 RepID=A0A2R8C9C2_9RHOB|nr:Thiol:disulfide interchange protein DsbD [Falsiruegeria mediterranea M17]
MFEYYKLGDLRGTMFDVTYFGALIAGLLSFLSPCILPIVPFYLSYLAGVGMNQISADSAITSDVRRRAFLAACCFALGVITIFMGLGATASAFGQMVREYFDILRWAAAALIIAMGLHFLGVVRIGFLYRQFRADAGDTSNVGYIGAYVIGLAFAFGWTPCVGPVLAAILFTAAGQDSAAQGATLLFVYGLGMTLPFVVAALFIGPFMSWMSRFRRHLGTVEKIMGGMLVLFGILIATNSINLIAQWMLEHIPWFSAIG